MKFKKKKKKSTDLEHKAFQFRPINIDALTLRWREEMKGFRAWQRAYVHRLQILFNSL